MKSIIAIFEGLIERMTIYRNMMAAVARGELTQPEAEELMRYMGEHNG